MRAESEKIAAAPGTGQKHDFDEIQRISIILVVPCIFGIFVANSYAEATKFFICIPPLRLIAVAVSLFIRTAAGRFAAEKYERFLTFLFNSFKLCFFVHRKPGLCIRCRGNREAPWGLRLFGPKRPPASCGNVDF